jgi:colanic acid biosynthesis protein WcaH
MKIKKTIENLEKYITDPKIGLPEEVFLFISRTTPLVNVDLLIKDENGRTLLSWRDDIYAGTGWHIPGGIIRFKETFEARLLKVAEKEIGTVLQYDPVPIAINQIIGEQGTDRAHFISLLYKCFLSSDFVLQNAGRSEKDPGFLAWHNSCPTNLVKVQEIYKKYI